MQKKLLYIKLTNGYKEGFAYQENILPYKFRELGYDVHLFASRRSRDDDRKEILTPEGEYINEKGIHVHILPFSHHFQKISRRLDRYDCLYRKIKEIKPDVIFVHAAQFLSLGAVYKYKKRNPKIKLYIDSHADYNIMPVDTLKRKVAQKVIFRNVIRNGERYVDRFYGVSPSRAEYLSEVYRIPREKIKVIPQGGDEEIIGAIDREFARKNIQKQYGIDGRHLIAVSGGGMMNRNKNIKELLEAVINLNYIDIVLLGTFPEAESKVCQELLNAKNVHYIGNVDGAETYQYFVAADFAVFPGIHSVMWDQAVASGTPVILRKWEGMDYFDINGNAVYLQNGTAAEITKVIESIARDEEKLSQMKIAAAGSPMKLFSYMEIAKSILELS